jgi:hypothetical protein
MSAAPGGPVIGFDRKIDIEWLDAVAERIAAGQTPDEIRRFVWSLLEGAVVGDSAHSGRGKTLTVLSRIWIIVPGQAKPLREDALRCIAAATGEQRPAIHWAMTIGTYPFFFDVATNVGKLLAINGQANLSQIDRKMTETWGDRSTLSRALQRVLRSMVQWGVLQDGPAKGLLFPRPNRVLVPDDIGELLFQAVLVSHGRGMPLAQLRGHPALFPFDVRLTASALRKSISMRLQRQGDQTDFVEAVQR